MAGEMTASQECKRRPGRLEEMDSREENRAQTEQDPGPELGSTGLWSQRTTENSKF